MMPPLRSLGGLPDVRISLPSSFITRGAQPLKMEQYRGRWIFIQTHHQVFGDLHPKKAVADGVPMGSGP